MILTSFCFIAMAQKENEIDSIKTTKIIPKLDSTKSQKVFIVDIKETIAPPILHKLQKAFEQAEEKNADLILIHMNTYGGMVETADSIRTKILNAKIPVIVYIDNNAASAGALISIACDSIYMRKGANIGAATVVNQNAEAMPDKYQSYMRSTMRSTAEAQGRDPNIAEAMVDPDVYVEGVSDSGKVLTFTTSEAIENGFCEGQAENIDEVLTLFGIENYETIELELSALDYIIALFINPYISGLLIMLIIGGIYFELQSPGIGFPLAAAIIAAILYFAPLYIEGLAANWEILIFIAGIVLIGVEIFVLPGFGIAGVSGVILIVSGLVLSMVGNVAFDFTYVKANDIIFSFFIVTISTTISLFGSVYLSKKLLTETAFIGKLALNTKQNIDEGYIASDNRLNSMIGKEGIATTMLRPSGKIEIGNDILDATAEIGYIEKGEKIVVIKYETMQLFVMKVDA